MAGDRRLDFTHVEDIRLSNSLSWSDFWREVKTKVGQTIFLATSDEYLALNKIGELFPVNVAIFSFHRGTDRYVIRHYRSMGSYRNGRPKLGFSRSLSSVLASRQKVTPGK